MKKYYAIAAMLLLAACASDKNPENISPEELYNTAFEDLEKTRYKKAAEGFAAVETEHPYSQWAVKAKLMGAYSYYKNEDYDDAVLALDRFIKYHPGNPDAPYAYYLKGICYYDQISAADKDQGDTEKANEAFNRLIMLYPNSKYADDARNKLKLTEDYKAGQEMIIGRYYLKNGNYLSALNRFNVVLEEYQTTVQIEEALYRQVEIYAILGLNRYAKGYYDILRTNYPEGEWTAKAAKVMEKIAEESAEKVKTETAEQKVSESAENGGDISESGESAESAEDTSWFGWFNSGSEGEEKTAQESAEVKNKEQLKSADNEPTAEEENTTSWFSWLSFGGDDEENAVSEQTAEEITVAEQEADEPAEESSSWFSWLSFGNAAAEENIIQPDTKSEKAEEPAEVTEKTVSEVTEAENKLQPAVSKETVGDILKENKGKK